MIPTLVKINNDNNDHQLTKFLFNCVNNPIKPKNNGNMKYTFVPSFLYSSGNFD